MTSTSYKPDNDRPGAMIGGAYQETAGEIDREVRTTQAGTPRTPRQVNPASVESGAQLPRTPTGPIRRDLARATDTIVDAADRLAGAAVDRDVPAIAVAANDLKRGLDVLWEFRRFGRMPWQHCIQLCRQALSEPSGYEDITESQGKALSIVCSQYALNRHMNADERKSVIRELTDGGFDVFRFLSQTG